MTKRWFLLMALCLPITIQAANDTIILQFTDTVTSVTYVPDSTLKQREIIIPSDSTSRRGHYVQAHVGLGYGSLGYSLEGAANRVNGSFSALLQLQYAYFFHPHWGIGAGVWFTDYCSMAHIGGNYQWLGQTDTDLEPYDHTASVQKWREREIIHNVGIPISLQFQYQKDSRKAGMFAAIGVAPSFSVMKQYKVLEGVIDHSGYYPAWDLLLINAHEFQQKQYAQEGTLSVRPQITCFVDIGVFVPLTRSVDFLLGGYFNMSANDANSSTKKAIGWKDADFTFMETYDGAYATTLSSASHPWEAGIKIGIHWHSTAPDKHATENYYEPFMREEITTRYVERADTTIIALPEAPKAAPNAPKMISAEEEHASSARRMAVAKEPQELLFKHVYFGFDSYALTSETQRYLNSIIDALNSIPEAKIRLEGHASSEGKNWYNDRLSKRRAQAVRDYLTGKGIDSKRIEIVGHGSRIPNKEKGIALKRDRRVEIKVNQNTNK